MSRSTKLASAAYIMSYVACYDPQQLTTDAIAEAVRDHPARVRQLVAALVRAGLLRSLRGAGGGIALARPPAEISLRDIHQAVEEQPLLTLSLRDPFKAWDNVCFVRPTLERLYAEGEAHFLERLAAVKLTALYTPRG
jgi:Rrf2 family protein